MGSEPPEIGDRVRAAEAEHIARREDDILRQSAPRHLCGIDALT